MNKSKKMNPIVAEDIQSILTQVEKRDAFKGGSLLITGCGGFLGFMFMQFFSGNADRLGLKRIIGLDNFKLGRPAWLDLLADRDDLIELQTFDIATDELGEIDHSHDVDYVLHMASIASPTFYRKYPIETLDANVWGLRRLLDFYRGSDLKGLLFFSSSEVYGDPDPEAIPLKENYRGNVATIGPRACYDEAKRFGETLGFLYAKEHGLPVRIVRPFNNYGPGMNIDDRRAPADFARDIINNNDIVLYSDGRPTRTFCYITDAVVGYLKALTYPEFDIFNIGADTPEISILELAEIFAGAGAEVANYTGDIRLEIPESDDYLRDNPSRRCPSIEKAQHLLGYSPRIGVMEGVERYLKYLLPQENQ